METIVGCVCSHYYSRRFAVSSMRAPAISRFAPVLVGNPVDGPPRITSTITMGNSDITAKPMASDFSAKPGPDVEVAASEPAKAAPSAVVIPAFHLPPAQL